MYIHIDIKPSHICRIFLKNNIESRICHILSKKQCKNLKTLQKEEMLSKIESHYTFKTQLIKKLFLNNFNINIDIILLRYDHYYINR